MFDYFLYIEMSTLFSIFEKSFFSVYCLYKSLLVGLDSNWWVFERKSQNSHFIKYLP